MGKIITKGIATRVVNCDKASVDVEFRAKELDSNKALKQVTEACESFLAALENGGMDLSEVTAVSNSVRKTSWRDEEQYFEASRGVSFVINFDLALIAGITKIIEDGSYSVDFRINPFVGIKKDIHRELIIEATHNARKKADMIAEATGAKVVGVERIKVEANNDYIFDDDNVENNDKYRDALEAPGLAEDAMRYSKTRAPSTEEKEEIYVEWILESVG